MAKQMISRTCFVYTCAFLLGMQAFAADSDRKKVFQEVVETLEREYYDPEPGGPDWKKRVAAAQTAALAAKDESGFYAAVSGLLATLRDGHTGVSSPASVRSRKAPSRMSLGFQGRFLEGRLAVTRVLQGAVVEGFGVQTGWTVRSVGGSSVPESSDEFARWISELGVGELCGKGSVAIVFEDEDGNPREFNGACTALPQIEPVRSARREGDKLYVAFDRFDGPAADWFDRVVDENRDAKFLILDLRENTGGRRSALLRIAGRLWPDDRSLGTGFTRRGQKEEFKIQPLRAFQGKIAAVVDSNTQSAAEILAAAIQESGRGVVFGRKTAGSVLVMLRKRLPDGGEIRYSVEDFLTARGVRLQGAGVRPDRELPFGLKEVRARVDTDLLALEQAYAP